ncbi:MAG: hypothetical protein KBC67_03190 [Candidatus Pacebacteria bacterium]|nr:hypothetical protein [Candidatus Paceibacterota bacterium]
MDKIFSTPVILAIGLALASLAIYLLFAKVIPNYQEIGKHYVRAVLWTFAFLYSAIIGFAFILHIYLNRKESQQTT